jgi:hypothetical protein
VEGGPARLAAIGKRLRRQLPEKHRDAVNPLEGSVLDKLIDDTRPPPLGKRAGLPSKTRIALEALRTLKIAMPSEALRQVRNGLRTARESLDRIDAVRAQDKGQAPESVEQWVQMSAQYFAGWQPYREVEQELAVYEELVRGWEALVQRMGYHWNWDTRVLEIRSGARGGRPRRLFRDIVEALLRHFQISKNTVKERKRIASELAPFFSDDLLDISKGSTLCAAMDNILLSEPHGRRR